GAGWAEDALHDVVARLGVPVRLGVSRVHRRGVPAVRVEVLEETPPHSRAYPALDRLLAESRIDDALRRPAMAVLEPLAGVEGELLTPTGAVLLATLVCDWGPLPPLQLERVGTGAGAADPPRANVLRLFVGGAPGAVPAGAAVPDERTGIDPGGAHTERLTVLETSIGDMNPQPYPPVTARLIAAGALDVTVIPAVMKKGRPGHLLRVLGAPDQAQALCAILLAETTTLGVRTYEVTRITVRRRTVEVETAYGPVPVKIAEGSSGVLNMSPEFEACRVLAERRGVPVKRVIAAAQQAAAAFLDPIRRPPAAG